jgi:hypothetical protein
LRDLLERLNEGDRSENIENWETEGGVYLEYFQASFMIREIKQKVEVC